MSESGNLNKAFQKIISLNDKLNIFALMFELKCDDSNSFVTFIAVDIMWELYSFCLSTSV